MKHPGGNTLRKKRLRKKATRAMSPKGRLDGMRGHHIRMLQKAMVNLNRFINPSAPIWEAIEYYHQQTNKEQS